MLKQEIFRLISHNDSTEILRYFGIDFVKVLIVERNLSCGRFNYSFLVLFNVKYYDGGLPFDYTSNFAPKLQFLLFFEPLIFPVTSNELLMLVPICINMQINNLAEI